MATGQRVEGSPGNGSGLRALDGLLLLGAGIVAVVVLFALLGFIAGLIWFAIKVVVAVALVVWVGWLLFRRRS